MLLVVVCCPEIFMIIVVWHNRDQLKSVLMSFLGAGSAAKKFQPYRLCKRQKKPMVKSFCSVTWEWPRTTSCRIQDVDMQVKSGVLGMYARVA